MQWFSDCMIIKEWIFHKYFKKPTIPKYHTTCTYRLNPFNEVDKNANKIQYKSFFKKSSFVTWWYKTIIKEVKMSKLACISI
jgi:hypothetical protein